MTTPPTIPTWTIGDRIRKAREVAGLKQEEMADVTGISRQTLSNYEHGKTKASRANIKLIGLATGVDHHWILTGWTSDQLPKGVDTNRRKAPDVGTLPTRWYALGA